MEEDGIANNDEDNSKNDYLDTSYDFKGLCPLSESQLNIYLDESVKDMGTSYNIPFKIKFSKPYTAERIKDAIYKLMEIHPILSSRVVLDEGNVYFSFDAKPEINTGSLEDIDSFVQTFELEKSLSKFLIIENESTLCIDCHHLIFDGMSRNILINNLIGILEKSNRDTVDDGFLRQLRFEENLSSEDMDDAENFYNHMLADIDEAYDLIPAIAENKCDGEYYSDLDLDSSYLKSFLKSQNITFTQFFTSAFAYTLSRFTGSSKVFFKLVTSGRGHIDLSDSVGMFAQTLPLLFDCKNQKVNTFLSDSSTIIKNGIKYDYYPYHTLANKYDIASDILFQYAHNVLSFSSENEEADVEDLKHTEQGELSLFVLSHENKFKIWATYSDKYSEDLIEKIVETYKLISQEMINKGELSEINYTLESDLKILDEYNNTEIELEHKDILDAFNENLAKYPDNVLVSFKEKSYTYAEGAFIAEKIAERLVDLGVGPQDYVAYLVERSELYLFNTLAILSIGAVYVPLDDAHPDERIEYILNDTQSKVLIVSDETIQRAKELEDDAIIFNISDILQENYGKLDNLPIEYGELACILYTSGTTGLPKGVKITRKAILNLSEFYNRVYNLSNDDVYALFASIGFDVAMKAIFPSLCAGATLTIVPNDVKLNMKAMNEYFIKQGVTHTEISTQVAKLFISQVNETSLKVLTTGGEKLGDDEIDVDYRFVDSYGPTEACVDVTSIDASDRIDHSSIGFLLANIKAYVLDDELRRVPIGAVGELHLAGNQIAKGYLNRQEETEKAFLANPFDDEEDYAVMYASGDMVRSLPDGSLGIVGRKDEQVKIRGNRVELSEIEAVIREIDYVEDLTVQTVKNGTNNELVAYVVAREEHDDEDLKESICSYVSKYKPPYMVPSFVIPLDEIPLNVNGKVDKRALPDVDRSSSQREYVAPSNDIERDITNAFEKVFNQEKIGVCDDFTQLGGDSLTAIKLISLLNEYNITAGDILSLRTPNAIAKGINELSLDLNLYSLESGCPLNEPQLNVYLDIIANDKWDSYHVPIFMEISKEHNRDFVHEALDEIINVHPLLGMCVSDELEVPYLIKGSPCPILMESDIDEEFILDFLNKPFDLNKNLCRFLIVENEDNYSLFAVFHHIIFDALSESVFKKDLQSILNGESLDVDDSFLKASAFAEQIKDTPEYTEAHDFYEKHLADIDEVGILLDSITPNGPGMLQLDLDIDIGLLHSNLENYKVSENVLFISVFAYTLSRFVGNDKVLFNITENGRDRFQNLNSIGMYVNTLPIQLNCENKDIGSFMNYVSSATYDVMKYNYYPFRLLANEFHVESNLIFQFLPDWIGVDDCNEDAMNFKDMKNSEKNNITDLSVEVVQTKDKYTLRITYSDKYSREFIESFASSYNLIIDGMLKHKHLSEINYISNEDLEKLNEYNDTEHPLSHKDVLDAFNDNLSIYPENNFVSTENRVYTYEEGAFISRKIAEKLIELGVKTQDCVAYLTERSEYYMFSTLAIMSIGAIYVPLDDMHPDNRISFILSDTKAKVLIVSDETYERGKNISDDAIIFNISELVNESIGTLSNLPVTYGNIACMLYTSGTTGIPKGVRITRKSIINLVTFYQDKYEISNEDIYGLYASIGFDAALLALAVVLYSGACLTIIPSDVKLDMNKMNEYFIRHNVTQTLITTQVGKLFMQTVDKTSLKVLLVGGEKLGEFQSPENYKLIDAYGPTETCIYITSIANKDKIDPTSIGSLGYNTKVYVLDNEFRRVPIGAVGELFISGHQVSDGYLNRDEENKKAFLENAFEDDDEYKLMYRTADMVRILPDGTIGIVGRKDSQVKIRGNRVELSEIESAIHEIDCIDDATVQTIKNGSNNELVAYVVASREIDNIKDYVCNHVAENKPEYMVPSFVIELDKIPLTVNGKVDRRSLPTVDMDDLHADYLAPRNEIEKRIVESYEEVINHERISVNDDFIRLGGDSLSAIKLMPYLSDYNVTVADILRLKTPAAIANSINENSLELDLDKFSLDSPCPLNEPQLNVYLDIITQNKYDSYFIPFTMTLPKEYSPEEIENALDAILDAHPILSRCISNEFMVPSLVKGSKPSIQVESDIDDESIIAFLTEPIDLYDSLCRFLIVEKEDNNLLYAVFHHIVFDALSNNVFKRDLLSILEGKSVETDDSFLKVAAFNQEIEKTKEYREANNFFEAMLADSDDIGVLLDSVTSEGAGIAKINLDLNYDSFQSFLTENRISENILFTSVFAYTLSRFVGNDNVLFNIIENGRDRFNNFNAIGMFVNTLPLLVNCQDQDIKSFMKDMSGLIYDTMRYNFYPFRLLANEYDITANIIFQYLPEWVYEYEDSDEIDSSNPEDDLLNDYADDMISDFVVEVIENEKSYLLQILYSDKYSNDFIKSFMESYNLVLNEMINVAKLSNINYITDEDIELLDTYNQTEHELDYDDILDAFNDNLAKYPDNNLVSMHGKTYSYAEGAYIADAIAKELLDLGITGEDFVGFLTERSEHYLFATLGILSIGAIYVPLDNAHPDERIKFMIEDTNSKAVIVSDETYERAKKLTEDISGNIHLLNISELTNEDIGTLSHLPVSYGDLACILYTSGTTGIPKGVKSTRKSFLNVVSSYHDQYEMDRDDVYGLYSAIGFDAGSLAMAQTIYSGACLSIIPEDIKSNMDAMNEYFLKENISHTMITTQVGKLFMDSVNNDSLDVLLVGGEKLGEFDNYNDYCLVDGFGPTEAFSFVSVINNDDKLDYSSIGKMNYNTKAYVLDKEFRQVPIGAVGELCLAGYQIAEGYLNRDEETSKAFIENPFSDDEEYSRLYRSGDMVRILPDGSYAIVGRRDTQVKIRGNRVELSEVESAIRELDCIEDVTTLTIKYGTNNELVAYVVPLDDIPDDELDDIVCDYVRETKPKYMIPSFVIKLDNIPLNVNGKVDKRALPKINLKDMQREYVAPRNEIERVIVEAFEEVFNEEKISLFDDFTRLGGNSIIAIKIISKIHKNNLNCNVQDLMSYKTPYLIAYNLDKPYGFELVKQGEKKQNMFIIPPQGGLSIILNNLVEAMDFEGNVYLINDYKYELSIDEIKNSDYGLTVEKYYESIKDIFQEGDIITGYSLGCISALLIAEKLEKSKSIDKCILIDGPLNFVHHEKISKEDLVKEIESDFKNDAYNMDKFKRDFTADFVEKMIEICLVNSEWDFHTPKVKSHLCYIAVSTDVKDELNQISSDNEYIEIESTHKKIIGEDVGKIAKYLK